MTFTEESKKKISDKLKGKPLSEETKLKMSESKKGKIPKNILTEEFKNKAISSQLGRKQSAETIANRVKKNTGKKRSEEVKKKMSESMIGIKKGPMSEENKLKRSKRIALIDDDGNIMKEYNSFIQCATELNIHKQRINEFFSGKRESYKNLKFKLL